MDLDLWACIAFRAGIKSCLQGISDQSNASKARSKSKASKSFFVPNTLSLKLLKLASLLIKNSSLDLFGRWTNYNRFNLLNAIFGFYLVMWSILTGTADDCAHKRQIRGRFAIDACIGPTNIAERDISSIFAFACPANPRPVASPFAQITKQH